MKKTPVVRLVVSREDTLRFPSKKKGHEATIELYPEARYNLAALCVRVSSEPEFRGKRVIIFADVSRKSRSK